MIRHGNTLPERSGVALSFCRRRTYPIKVDSDGNPENYFLVTNALTLKAQFNKALNSILEKNGSITQPTVTSTDNASLSDAYIYRTTFDSDGWTGDLIKEKRTSSSGQITTTSQWKASEKLTSSSSRQIKMANCQLDQNSNCTWSLKDFNWNNLSDSQKVTLDHNDGLGSKRVDFIRGQTGDSSFRSRTSLLGDIVHSSPALVAGAQYLTYRAEALEGSGTYQTFRDTIKNRKNAIYVGANDGMLHAFDADTGTELFAFIPSAVISNLNKLTDATYGVSGGNLHQYYVDGTPVTAEVYSGGSWHSILVGTLGAGGREVFALDITDPATPKLLWEFTSDDDGDLDYTLGKPAITRLHTGDWAVLIPNGYNNDSHVSGKAVLFVLNAYTGEQLGKLQATSSTAQDNGLSSIRPVDVNSDGITDYAYAGDLQGNLWRFDLLNTAATEPLTASVSKEQLAVAFGGEPLYVAKDDSSTGTRQPITALPQVIRHPSLKGYIVAFGTGRYLGESDKTNNNPQTQTVYGIWDPYTLGETTNGSTPRPDGRTSLQSQAITSGTGSNASTRTISSNSIALTDWYDSDTRTGDWGWYLDLDATIGERVIDEITLYRNYLLISSIYPDSDSCTAGLSSYLYALNPYTGGKVLFNVFNLDTGSGSSSDIVSGIAFEAGGFTIWQNQIVGSNGGVTSINAFSGAQGRQTWRQLPATSTGN